MIRLYKLNDEEIWLNPLLIELVSAHADCVITLSNGHKYVVREQPEVVAQRIREFLRGLSLRIPSDCSVVARDDGTDGEGERSGND